jgi:hypothetical protein
MKNTETAEKIVEIESFSEAKPSSSSRPRKGIYLLPNLLTTGALFGGFYWLLILLCLMFLILKDEEGLGT